MYVVQFTETFALILSTWLQLHSTFSPSASFPLFSCLNQLYQSCLPLSHFSSPISSVARSQAEQGNTLEVRCEARAFHLTSKLFLSSVRLSAILIVIYAIASQVFPSTDFVSCISPGFTLLHIRLDDALLRLLFPLKLLLRRTWLQRKWQLDTTIVVKRKPFPVPSPMVKQSDYPLSTPNQAKGASRLPPCTRIACMKTSGRLFLP